MERLGLMFGLGKPQKPPESPRARQSERNYAFNEALLNSNVYLPSAAGGFRELILEKYFNLRSTEVTRFNSMFNPFRPTVDAYQNIFRGVFGDEIKVAEQFDGKLVNAELPTAIRSIWRMSNLDTRKQTMQEWGANLGTVGLRIVAKDADNQADKRVSVQIEHPSYIYDFDENDRGDLIAVELRYQQLQGAFGEDRDLVDVREVITRESFFKTVDGKDVLEENEKVNALGVCPYVILRHRDQDEPYGAWAYKGAEPIVFALNWLASNQADSIYEHIWPTWLGTAGGDPPTTITTGRTKFLYVKTDPDTPPPSLAALVPNLNQADALRFFGYFWDRLRHMQPEMVLGDIPALSGQSGETIAQLLIATKSRIELAKPNYEHALIRALQIAMSYGVLLGKWDLGTGMRTPEAANSAYQNGNENFAFEPRSTLPPTVYEQVQQAMADTTRRTKDIADAKNAQPLVGDNEALKIAGYKDTEIQKILDSRKTTDLTDPVVKSL